MNIDEFCTKELGITDPQLLHDWQSSGKIKHVQKGEIIQNIGDIDSQVHILMDGLLRGFFFDLNGKEITDCFGFIPGTPVMSCLGLNMPTPLCIEALETSTLLMIPLDVIQTLLETNLEMNRLYNRLLHTALMMHWQSKIMLAQHGAPQRYQWFLEQFPGLIDRVTHKHIASFLGMSPVSLSRIRKAIREQGMEDA